jgi:predicted CXXCH cytochrome family protein
MMAKSSSRRIRLGCLLGILCSGAIAEAQESVVQTVHNLSAGGPGRVRAQSEGQVCVFCHAPHHASGMPPLWNREMPFSNYTIYRSSTLDAKPGQPTGASKLCLSCHDGTIALGSVLSRAERIRMVGGTFMPAGLTNLGTDLSDDHPVSFAYTSGLAGADRQLAAPTGLPERVALDAAGELQCTSCHDPHDNSNGMFLVMRNEFGALCTACHIMDGWKISAHKNANASVAGVRLGDWPYSSVAENACRSCHRPHTAGGRERLLIFENDEDNCLICHDGQVADSDIRQEIDKYTAHDPRRYTGLHDPLESPSADRAHVECADCHNPHAVENVLPGTTYVPIGPTLRKVRGVATGGAPLLEARHEYEVCFRCHGQSPVEVSGRVFRQSQNADLRLKFSPTAVSFHPVTTSSPSRDTVSLAPGMSRGDMIRCTDCHNNDSGPRAGGSGPDGPHGSTYDFLLERNYTVLDDTVESAFEYALCYKCHQRSVVLSDRSFSGHRLHVVEQRSPCSACHDPHGISATGGLGSDHTHLINFDTRIVQRASTTRRLSFQDLGTFAGSCTLLCHGVEHQEWQYGPQGPVRTTRDNGKASTTRRRFR